MMKSLLSLVLTGALLGTSAHAAFDLGNGASLTPTGDVGLKYNDNIFLSNSNAKTDSILDLTPGLQLQFGGEGLTQGQLSYSEDFQFYTDTSNLNTALAKVDLLTAYDDGKMKLNVNGWFHQANQATRDIRGANFLVRRDLVHGDVMDEVAMTEKTAVSVGVGYDDTDYKRPGYVSWQWWELPVKYYYKIEPKLDLSAGFRYRDNKLDNGADSTEYFYSVGARGELAPKADGEVNVGLNQQRLSRGGSRNGFGIDSNLNYEVSPKTSVVLGLRNGYGYSSGGDSYRDFGLNGGISADISSNLRAIASLGYDKYSYVSGQKDDFYQGQLGATYLVNANVTLTGAYTYAKDKSNVAGASFKNNIFAVSAALRF
jgi:hypothetical protein